jgi:hypothetical protein
MEVLFLVNALEILESIDCLGFALGTFQESEILHYIRMGFAVSKSQPQGIKRNPPLKFRKVFEFLKRKAVIQDLEAFIVKFKKLE